MIPYMIVVRILLLHLLYLVFDCFVMFKEVAVLFINVIPINIPHIMMRRLKNHIKYSSWIASVHGLTNSFTHYSETGEGPTLIIEPPQKLRLLFIQILNC